MPLAKGSNRHFGHSLCYGEDMKLFFEMFLASLLFIGFYGIVYEGAFSVCLSDDVEFHCGKTRMRNRRKKGKGFWRKFLFLDIRKEVVPWHYAMFCVNLISFLIALITLNVTIACGDHEIVRMIFILSAGAFVLSAAITAFVRWPLYAWNKVRSRKKYRKR